MAPFRKLRSKLGLKKNVSLTDNVDIFNDDEPYYPLYRRAIQKSQGGRMDNVHKLMRYTALAQALKQAATKHPDLDVAECGCFFGHSTYLIATLMQQTGSKGGLHVFDSFEGLSEFGKDDHSERIKDTEASRKYFASDFDKVSALVSDFDFVHLYKGWIPERFSEVKDKRFSFVSIDVDLYQPTFDSMEFFYPRLADGGLMYLDDYGYNDFPGARKAVDSYLEGHDCTLFMRLPSGGAFLLK